MPRGRLRYTLNGANPREGQEYTGAFEIGLEETLIQVFAEDGEVRETRSFRVPKVGQTGPVIDPARPATLKKKLEFSGPAEVFKLLNRAKQGKAHLVSPALADDTAHVSLSVRGMEFATGHDLNEILAEFDIKPAAGEVEQ
ncbi:MAG: chitobiase/beta-hexosaminidase C-terminal domain-containing protein [Gammaproteobacteria bacterium]